MIYTPDKIRNIAVVGHQGSGKTTLVEALAYITGLIKEKGRIEEKDTISDYRNEEKKRQMSLSSSIIPLAYKDYKINLIDLPGNDDFIYEQIGITRLIKGAVLVIDASKGVQVGTRKAFKRLKKRGVPIFIYLNKRDKDDVDFDSLYEEIKEKLDEHKCVPFSYPIGHREKFDGFVNVPEKKARKFNGSDCVDDVIYDDKKAIIFSLYNRLCESVAYSSEDRLDKFCSGEPLTDQDRQLLEISQDSNRIVLLNKTDLEEKIELDQLPTDIIKISVLHNQNIDKIEERINQLFFENAGIVEQDATYLSNARHISLIEKALESLQAVNQGLEMGMPVDLLQVDMTRTWEILGEITGDG